MAFAATENGRLTMIKFSELTNCPFCGWKEFFTKDYIYGPSTYYQRFDGLEADNTEMYECTTTEKGVRAYCGNCGKYLGNTATDKIGKAALKAYFEEYGEE